MYHGKARNASTKKKAGDKAKSFEIAADTKDLTAGAHTVTYVVKLANKTCELITLNLNVGGFAGESGSESDTSVADNDGCRSAIGVGASIIALATISGAGIVIKRKKED